MHFDREAADVTGMVIGQRGAAGQLAEPGTLRSSCSASSSALARPAGPPGRLPYMLGAVTRQMTMQDRAVVGRRARRAPAQPAPRSRAWFPQSGRGIPSRHPHVSQGPSPSRAYRQPLFSAARLDSRCQVCRLIRA